MGISRYQVCSYDVLYILHWVPGEQPHQPPAVHVFSVGSGHWSGLFHSHLKPGGPQPHTATAQCPQHFC